MSSRISIRTLGLLGFLLWGDITYSQRYLTTFGAITELRAPRGAVAVAQGDFNGDGTADLVVQSDTRLLVYSQSASGESWRSLTVPFAAEITALAAGRCNKDRSDDLVLLTEHPFTISVWLSGRRERFTRRWQTPLGGQFENIIVGDLNSDGRNDILVYGKKELGVLAYLGNGDGAFQDPVTLFPEYSVGAVAIADVNKDRLNDLFVTNWLSNQVLVYENFGKLTFSDPTPQKLAFEPGPICVARMDSDINEDLVIGGADAPLAVVYQGDGLGSYRRQSELQLSSPPARMFCADANGDGANDLVAFCPGARSLEIGLNDGNGRLAERVSIAGGQQPASAVVIAQAPKGEIAAAVLDGPLGKVRLFASARRPRKGHQGALHLATGRRPEGVAIVDLNRDGWNDLVVADAASRDVAGYLNDSVKGFAGPVPFQTTANMNRLLHRSRRNGSHLLVSGAPDTNAIVVLEVNAKTFSHKTTLIPSAGRVDVLGIASAAGRVRILGLEHDEQGTASILEYDELEGGRFAERALVPVKGLIAAAAGAPDAERRFPIAYLARTDTGLGLSVVREGGGAQSVTSFAAAGAAELWLADLNRDGREDVVVHFGEPENTLKFIYSQGEAWGSPVTFQKRISIAGRDRLAFVDLNGDGVTDLVAANELTRTIDLMQARFGGTFLPPARLATAEAAGGFAIGDLDHDGIPELAITDAVNGGLRIIRLEER